MVKIVCSLIIILGISPLGFSQTNFGEFIPNVMEDIQQFGEAYIAPAADGAMYNINSGWYTTAKSKSFPEFEISITSNTSLVPKSDNNFQLDPSAYNTIYFEEGNAPKTVSTIFGAQEQVSVFIDYDTGDGVETIEIELPPGIDTKDRSYLPSVFLQGNLGLFKGTELKLRYSPEVKFNDISTKVMGAALQHEFTSWSNNSFGLPVAIAGLVSYSNFDGVYHISTDNAEDAAIVSELDSWSFSIITSKSISNFELFAGIDYSVATSVSKFTGLYSLPEEGEIYEDILNQITVTNKMNGLSGTLGASYLWSKLKINLALNIQEYHNISLGFAYAN